LLCCQLPCRKEHSNILIYLYLVSWLNHCIAQLQRSYNSVFQTCLPDCDETLYTASVSAAKFRPCDFKNLGQTPLCNLGDADISPPIWGSSVLGQYSEVNGGEDNVPSYISSNVMTNKRSYVNKYQVRWTAPKYI
jgi:hypothetical protein